MGFEFTKEDSEKLEKLFTDMYLGKDKDNPSITVRLDRLERMMFVLSKVSWVALAAVIGQIVLRLLNKV